VKVKEFTYACILTAVIIVIEVLAAATGEFLVVLTMASTLPIYIICRRSITLGIISYICVGVILLQINPHQLIFFIFTNGLLGISLGFCDKKIMHAVMSILISGIMLFIGIIITVNLIGIFIIKWNTGIFAFLFSCVYAAFYRFVARKVYEKLNKIESTLKR